MFTIAQWCKEHGITEIEALMPDMSGIARGKIMPTQKYCQDAGMRLPEALVLQTVTGDYTEDESAIHPSDRDMQARGDPNTIRMVPWASEPTAQIIHDCFHADGSPVETTSRYILRRVLERYEEKGLRPVIAPELEFYLVKPDNDSGNPLEPPLGRSGRAEIGRQAYGIDALNEFDPLIEDIYNYCEAEDIHLETVAHESGAAQMEINLLHGDALDLADQAFLFKRTVREAALRRGMYATFMAKPMQNEPGSSMHIHQSILDADRGKNIFITTEGQHSAVFFAYIAGLQKYLPACMSFLAPNVNSYRRISRLLAAPINVQWGYDNRTTGLRVPDASAENTRIENRVAGADANPYLAIAASLACGYLGLCEQLEPNQPVAGSAYNLPFTLPRNLEESLILLDQNEVLNELIGAKFIGAYTAVKTQELTAFLQVISSWEREYLLFNV